MKTSALPWWRRSVSARFFCIALVMLSALTVHGWKLDAELPLRLAVLVAAGLAVALVMPFTLSPSHSHRLRWGRGSYSFLLDAFVHAALLAALWPPTVALWPATIALALALIAQRLLGGWSVNPFPPALLALGIGVAWARGVSGADFSPALVSLFDAGIVAAVWLGAGIVLILLRLWSARVMIAFALPVALAFANGGVAATSLVAAAIVAGIVLADTRHLPATGSGQLLTGAFAGLGTAALWLQGAPPVAIAFPVLLACAMSPWIEHLTLPRIRPDA